MYVVFDRYLEKEDETKMKQGDLPDFFRGLRFYVSYGDFTEYTLLDIIRVIFAYDGTIERQIDGNVDYVITKRLWNPDFDKVRSSFIQTSFQFRSFRSQKRIQK